jgi:hypothetical protein
MLSMPKYWKVCREQSAAFADVFRLRLETTAKGRVAWKRLADHTVGLIQHTQ